MGRPCEEERYWPAACVKNRKTGKIWVYEAQTTRPLQDHREDGKGITIHGSKDNRAQPWVELIRANIHKRDITYLPPKKASCKETCEFIFLVLAKENVKGSMLNLDKKPWLASISIMQWIRWGASGKHMRKFNLEQWCKLCPGSWRDVVGEVHFTSKEDRDAVGKHIYTIINSLVVAEQMALVDKVSRFEITKDLKLVSLASCKKEFLIAVLIRLKETKCEKKMSRFARFKKWLFCARNGRGCASDALPMDTFQYITKTMNLTLGLL